MHDDELIAHLAEGREAQVDPLERAELDRVRALLADPAVWTEPDPRLQERVVAAVAEAGSKAGARRKRYALLGAAAALVLAVGLAVGLNARGGPSAEYAATLTGTELARGASGEVTMTRTQSGWEIHLRAAGLPRRDHGAYYEAWLKNKAAQLVAIGTFNDTRDVTLWAGISPRSHPRVTVTRQLANGDPASSGDIVLIGTAHPTP